MVVGVLQCVEGVGLGGGAQQRATMRGPVLGRAPLGVRAGQGGGDTNGGQTLSTQTLPLRNRLCCGLLPGVPLEKIEQERRLRREEKRREE